MLCIDLILTVLLHIDACMHGMMHNKEMDEQNCSLQAVGII